MNYTEQYFTTMCAGVYFITQNWLITMLNNLIVKTPYYLLPIVTNQYYMSSNCDNTSFLLLICENTILPVTKQFKHYITWQKNVKTQYYNYLNYDLIIVGNFQDYYCLQMSHDQIGNNIILCLCLLEPNQKLTRTENTDFIWNHTPNSV